jgi:hypothetical protein
MKKESGKRRKGVRKRSRKQYRERRCEEEMKRDS